MSLCVPDERDTGDEYIYHGRLATSSCTWVSMRRPSPADEASSSEALDAMTEEDEQASSLCGDGTASSPRGARRDRWTACFTLYTTQKSPVVTGTLSSS